MKKIKILPLLAFLTVFFTGTAFADLAMMPDDPRWIKEIKEKDA
jgi:hypothetical protein